MSALLGNELLRGERVYLSRIRRDDLPHMARMWSDVEYIRHLMKRYAYPLTIEDMEGWYQEINKEGAEPAFAIRTLDDNRFVGGCGLKDIRWTSRHALFWIGIGDTANRGQGYGTDATLVLLKYGFLEINLNCVGLEVFSYNEPALAMYRKLGFRHDGSVRAFVYRDGEYHDMHMMSLLREEWEARYGAVARTRIGSPAQ